MNRILDAARQGDDPDIHEPVYTAEPAEQPPMEVSEQVKKQVKERDGYTCLCCGYSVKRFLQVDHIMAQYYGGGNILTNLQTLCKTCNLLKGSNNINFLDPQTDLDSPPSEFPHFKPPSDKKIGEASCWENFLRRHLNFYYQCSAVHSVTIGKRGKNFHNWVIELKAGNDPSWLEGHIERLLVNIQEARQNAGYDGPETITVD